VGYGLASGLSVIASLVGADFLERWTGEAVNRALLVEGVWLVSVGAPSLWVAGEQTLRALGRKPVQPWRQWGGRSVAVNVMESATRLVLKSDERRVLVTYMYHALDNNGLSHQFVDDDLSRALRLAWHRRHRNPWSRNAMMDSVLLSRDEYDAMMNLLQSVPGVVLDRGERRSGRIRLPPMTALEMVRGARGEPLYER